MLMRWHPTDPATLLGGLANGQIVIWDLQEWMKVNNSVLGYRSQEPDFLEGARAVKKNNREPEPVNLFRGSQNR